MQQQACADRPVQPVGPSRSSCSAIRGPQVPPNARKCGTKRGRECTQIAGPLSPRLPTLPLPTLPLQAPGPKASCLYSCAQVQRSRTNNTPWPFPSAPPLPVSAQWLSKLSGHAFIYCILSLLLLMALVVIFLPQPRRKPKHVRQAHDEPLPHPGGAGLACSSGRCCCRGEEWCNLQRHRGCRWCGALVTAVRSQRRDMVQRALLQGLLVP